MMISKQIKKKSIFILLWEKYMKKLINVILSKNSKECTGNFFIDEDILKDEGETNFDKYAVKPGSKLFEDLYLD